jgi:type II secretion system protein G
MKSEKRGFTLIELLVVIAIIGLLASIVLASLNSARRKSRDARRIADLKQLQNAMELYANDNSGNYPDVAVAATAEAITTLAAAGLGTSFIAAVPDDPLGGSVHYYWTTPTASATTQYCIGANLEGTPPVPADTCYAAGDTEINAVADPDADYFVGNN